MTALVLALALAATPTPSARPRLDVTWAAFELPAGAPVGRLRFTGRYAGVPIDPEGGFVELTIDGSTRFANLRGTAGDARLGIGSAEHGYALRLDPATGRIRALETDVIPPGDGPLRIELGAHGVRACTLLWLRRAGAAWRFDGRRDRQEACPAPTPSAGS